MSLDEFAGRRRELFQSLTRYLDRYRRVRIGPQAALVFENRQTLWFRVQDVLRVARLSEPARVQEELNLYNRLLPGPGCLQAALIIANDEASPALDIQAWQSLHGDDLNMRLGSRNLVADLVTCRPEDRAVGAAQWVQFRFSDDDRRLLANFRVPARFAVTLPGYSHESPSLSEDVRQSLLDDLDLSDKDVAQAAR